APGLPLNCGTHYLVELDGTNVDLAKFNQAWNQLVRYHEMMRVTIDTDGNQTILQHAVPVELYTISLNANSAAKAQQIIHDYWQQQRLAKNYNHHLYAIEYGQQRCRIGIIFNYLTLDGFSIKLILQQLAMLYENSDTTLPGLDLSFRDFVTQIETDNRTKNNDKTFWLEKLNTLPLAPQLPIAKQPEQLNQVIFKRYSHRLSANQWSQLKSKARQHQLTPSVILLTAYAHILAQWSANQPLSINLTLFDRPDIHPQINQIAGDFTTLAPVGYYPNSAHSVIEQAKAMQQEIVDALEHKTISSIWIQRERSKTMG
ncbi:Non-ribosomal peptide synthetase module, partial [Gilliamella apicola SCGC AB-598-B02]